MRVCDAPCEMRRIPPQNKGRNMEIGIVASSVENPAWIIAIVL
jgi:hypothetical protein